MKVDTGLQEGVRTLRQDDKLLDLTLKVDGQEFKVHKVVLASVSDYFHAMLCGSLKESNSDIIELKEISAELMSKILDFIYTGDSGIIKSNPREMLDSGVYFQIPRVVEECQKLLTRSVCISNCLELLSLFLTFPVDNTAETIEQFIKDHIIEVMNHYGPSKMTPEVIPLILDNWKKSEWDLFQYLTSWYEADCDNRKMYMDDFLCHVRFKLMTPDEITAVKESRVYAECDRTWKGLVDKAVTYHHLPIHKKVLDESVQSRVRCRKSVVVMNTGKEKKSSTYVLCKNNEKKHCWKKYPAAKPPKKRRKYPYIIEVNNFLIVWCESNKYQHWEVFDPRTLTWYEMANMPKPRQFFPIVYHGKQLYVLGGSQGYKRLNTSLVYDFDTDTWRSTINLPVAVTSHAACVIKDKIYVSGGSVISDGKVEDTARMDCLEISTLQWQNKASMLTPLSDHKMCVMKIDKRNSIVTISRHLEIDYYDPVADQWTTYDYSILQDVENPGDPARSENLWTRIGLWPQSCMVVRGNTIYSLQTDGAQLCYYDPDGNYIEGGQNWFSRSLCVKTIVPEEGSEIKEIIMKQLPFSYSDPDIIGALLAFPARSSLTSLT